MNRTHRENACERSARMLASMLALACCIATALAADPSAVALMRDNRCYVCHSNSETLAGPAFADVASAYRDNPHAVAIMSALIRAGASDGGPWHMPPHPELSAAQAKAIARYILELDSRVAPPLHVACPPRAPCATAKSSHS